MTMPGERARSLRYAGELLREILTRQDVPFDLKIQARGTLRHYPTPQQIEWMIKDSISPRVGVQQWLDEEPKD